ncbi:MAG: hypothetical protein WAV55_08115 [Clostridiaceae bacterium]
MKTKRSKLALIALLLSGAYVVYLFTYFTGGVSSAAQDSSEQLGMAIATTLVLPHFIVTLLGVLFNALGYFMRSRGFILVGAILYAVAMFFFIPYFMFLVIQTVLMFVSYARMKKTMVYSPPQTI